MSDTHVNVARSYEVTMGGDVADTSPPSSLSFDDDEIDGAILDLFFADGDDDDLVQGAASAIIAAYEDEEDEDERAVIDAMRKKGWGKNKSKERNKRRNFDRAHALIVKQYFSGEESTYDEKDFQRRFILNQDDFNNVNDKMKDFPEFQRKKVLLGGLASLRCAKSARASNCFRMEIVPIVWMTNTKFQKAH